MRTRSSVGLTAPAATSEYVRMHWVPSHLDSAPTEYPYDDWSFMHNNPVDTCEYCWGHCLSQALSPSVQPAGSCTAVQANRFLASWTVRPRMCRQTQRTLRTRTQRSCSRSKAVGFAHKISSNRRILRVSLFHVCAPGFVASSFDQDVAYDEAIGIGFLG